MNLEEYSFKSSTILEPVYYQKLEYEKTLRGIARCIFNKQPSISLPMIAQVDTSQLVHNAFAHNAFALKAFALNDITYYYQTAEEIYNILMQTLLTPVFRICTGQCEKTLEHGLAYCPNRLLAKWYFNRNSRELDSNVEYLLVIIQILENILKLISYTYSHQLRLSQVEYDNVDKQIITKAEVLESLRLNKYNISLETVQNFSKYSTDLYSNVLSEQHKIYCTKIMEIDKANDWNNLQFVQEIHAGLEYCLAFVKRRPPDPEIIKHLCNF